MNSTHKSEAYRMGFAALNETTARYGTSPSTTQRQDWGHAWGQFMAGWKAAQRMEVA